MDNSYTKGLNTVLDAVTNQTKIVTLPIMPDFSKIIKQSRISIGGTASALGDVISTHIYKNPIQGAVLAQDIVAHSPVPSHPTSIKDGYAVRSSDGPGTYPVIVSIRAGHDENGEDYVLPPKSIAYITTGSPLPNGADAVIEIEQTIDRGFSSGLFVFFFPLLFH